jgi:hypothetical protein
MAIFKLLAEQMYELYEELKNAGFDSIQAFELTKTYCTVAFANQSMTQRVDKDEVMRKYWSKVRERKVTTNEST